MSRFGRWLPLAAVAALLGAAMLAAAYANPSIDRIPSGERIGTAATQAPLTIPPPERTAAASGGPQDALSIPSWVGWALSVLCAAVVLLVVGLLLWMLLRDRLAGRRGSAAADDTPVPTPTDTSRRVRAALDEGLADLDEADADPRRVVIACWVRLEEAAAAAGVPRQVGDTSTDLIGRLLATATVSAAVSVDVLAPFAAVYREARFATHTVDTAMRDQARSALTRLRDELAAGAS